MTAKERLTAHPERDALDQFKFSNGSREPRNSAPSEDVELVADDLRAWQAARPRSEQPRC